MKILDKINLEKLIGILKQDGYKVIGPVIKDGVILYDEIDSIKDLPAGWEDEQDAASYRLKKTNERSLFSYVVGPQSWKKFIFPQRLTLWKAKREGKSFRVDSAAGTAPKYAFFGVRSCELSSILIQDRVFNNGMFADSYYNNVRNNILIVSVNCTRSADTCFCVSMKTGPKAKSGFDLSLTEVIKNDEHYFVMEEGSAKGSELAALLETSDAAEEQVKAAREAVQNAELKMNRTMNTAGIKELLYNNHDHPIWAQIASRCLSCANCTMVCPTCFCSNMEDTTDLSGENTERWRRWDSCFSLDYSKVTGGNFRTSGKARYRQWMTHKLASWIDQFGTSGCVGCGRCITWCPVGIDITREVEVLRNSPMPIHK
ncbi:MAG: 4Fe-4S dicluster domain-containing protein [Ignavibacteria bacterium]|nr:4Fe-4S dicluster domain-containing protein [Ignavibacteria bacterium]